LLFFALCKEQHGAICSLALYKKSDNEQLAPSFFTNRVKEKIAPFLKEQMSLFALSLFMYGKKPSIKRAKKSDLLFIAL